MTASILITTCQSQFPMDKERREGRGLLQEITNDSQRHFKQSSQATRRQSRPMGTALDFPEHTLEVATADILPALDQIMLLFYPVRVLVAAVIEREHLVGVGSAPRLPHRGFKDRFGRQQDAHHDGQQHQEDTRRCMAPRVRWGPRREEERGVCRQEKGHGHGRHRSIVHFLHAGGSRRHGSGRHWVHIGRHGGGRTTHWHRHGWRHAELCSSDSKKEYSENVKWFKV